MPDRPIPPTIPAPSATGLATCLLALSAEAHALAHPVAAHLIVAAAAELLEAEPQVPAPLSARR